MPPSAAEDAARPMTPEEKKVILASSVGTMLEWFEFYLYGSLAAVIGAKFFSMYPENTRNVFALLAFAAGFVVRPAGALVFGRLGDLIGRKYTFLVTILIMGGSTFAVGCLPTAETIGVAAPVLLIALRMLQGLALGGEYGGAAVYVAEHAPAGRRGFYTSFIQITATAGLFLSLLVILGVQGALGDEAFRSWGWRVPFLTSFLLLVVSVWIRLQLQESPAWRKMKDEGRASRAPLKDAFGNRRGAWLLFVALFGLTAGQAVVWYTGQFYALFFLQSVLKVDGHTANLLVAWSLLLGAPFFVVFGALSDRAGRKPVILGGCLLAALFTVGIFQGLAAVANPALARAHAEVPVVVRADPAECSFQFNPTGTAAFTSGCDVALAALSRAGAKSSREDAAPGLTASVQVGGGPPILAGGPGFARELAAALTAAGYPAASNPSVVRMAHPFDIWRPQTLFLVFLLWVLVIFVTMVYGPIAAALVELYPTRIRYSGMSLPYHLGNGWFGGLLPATAFAISAQSGDLYAGLRYPLVVALLTVAVGVLFVPETKDRDIFEDDARR